jgi:hypothetical protein
MDSKMEEVLHPRRLFFCCSWKQYSVSLILEKTLVRIAFSYGIDVMIVCPI